MMNVSYSPSFPCSCLLIHLAISIFLSLSLSLLVLVPPFPLSLSLSSIPCAPPSLSLPLFCSKRESLSLSSLFCSGLSVTSLLCSALLEEGPEPEGAQLELEEGKKDGGGSKGRREKVGPAPCVHSTLATVKERMCSVHMY